MEKSGKKWQMDRCGSLKIGLQNSAKFPNYANDGLFRHNVFDLSMSPLGTKQENSIKILVSRLI